MWKAAIVGGVLGIILGNFLPTVSYVYSKYLAIGIVAALDSVFGGMASNVQGKFDVRVFVSGFFVNAILSIFLTYLGQRLNVDIYLAAIIVFVGRMFNNLGILRRYYVKKLSSNKKEKAEKTEEKDEA